MKGSLWFFMSLLI